MDARVDDWVRPVSTDCLALSHSTSSHPSFLVLSGAEMPQRGVSSVGIVEALDVLEDRHPRCLAARPRVSVDQLSLQGRDETLGHRIVVGIGHRSHRG